MKKTSEALSRVQDEAAIRRQLLESGKIRLIPKKPKSQPQQDDETSKAQKKDSS